MSNPAIMMYVPFALNGQKREIPVTNPSTANPQDASYNTGFPDITMTPDVGEPPNGTDFNGIFYAITLDLVHRQSGKQIQYDATYATNIGGYAKGSVLQSADLTKSYISTADGNLTDPDSSSSKNWSVYSQPPLATSTTVGTVKINNTLTSAETDSALTANQGRVLNESIASLFAKNSLSSNGYQYLGKLLIQWGTIDYDSNPGEVQATVNLPISFPSAILNVQATRKMSQHSANGDGGINVVSISLNSILFSVQTYNNTNSSDLRGFMWIAIGY
jgi:hypothetical protein